MSILYWTYSYRIYSCMLKVFFRHLNFLFNMMNHSQWKCYSSTLQLCRIQSNYMNYIPKVAYQLCETPKRSFINVSKYLHLVYGLDTSWLILTWKLLFLINSFLFDSRLHEVYWYVLFHWTSSGIAITTFFGMHTCKKWLVVFRIDEFSKSSCLQH